MSVIGKNIKLFFSFISISYFFLSGCGKLEEMLDNYLDNKAPLISFISPIDGYENISLDTSISVTFSDEINPESITANISDTSCSGAVQLSSDDFTSCVKFKALPSASDENKTFTLQPAENLSYFSTYKIRVTRLVEDSSKNNLDTQWTATNGFTTESEAKTEVPSLISMSPEDEATSVAKNSSFSISFSDAMDVSTITTNTSDTSCSGSIQLSSDDFTTCIQIKSAATASNSNMTFTFKPNADLNDDTLYKLKVTKDAKNSAATSIASDWMMTTGFKTSKAQDSTAPTVELVSPKNGDTDVLVTSTTIKVVFSESIDASTVTVNTENTTCSASVQISLDDFSSCLKFSSTPSVSNSNKSFSLTLANALEKSKSNALKTYKIKLTTAIKDSSENALSSEWTMETGFTTEVYSTGTIKGRVVAFDSSNNISGLEGVTIKLEKDGSSLASVTSDSDGNFSKGDLEVGEYTIKYEISGYKTETQTAKLETDGQVLNIEQVAQLIDTCGSGKISGKITNAVTGQPVGGVSLKIRDGINTKAGNEARDSTTTAPLGTYNFPGASAGYYTVETNFDGYVTSYFTVYACGDKANQDASISPSLAVGTMRIVLSWPDRDSGDDAKDLDSHLSITKSNGTDKAHVYYRQKNYYPAKENFTCSGCTGAEKKDLVSLDVDKIKAPGTETITIVDVKDGDYYYRVHDYSNKRIAATEKLKISAAQVTVYYNKDDVSLNATITKYNVPSSGSGALWQVFKFNKTSGLEEVGILIHKSIPREVFNDL